MFSRIRTLLASLPFIGSPQHGPCFQQEADAEAHRRGEAMAFFPAEFRSGCVGFIDGERPVVAMLDGLHGFAMTRESATALADELDAALSITPCDGTCNHLAEAIGASPSTRHEQAEGVQPKASAVMTARAEPDPLHLAEVAYTAYGASRGWVVASGAPMPQWSEQAEGFRYSWAAGMVAVLAELRAAGFLQ